MTLRPEYAERAFDGADYIPARDDKRLGAQCEDIRKLMLDGNWRTLEQIAAATGHPPASISAQLRHLRKERFGAYTVEKCYCGNGLYRYRVSGGHPVQLALRKRRESQ